MAKATLDSEPAPGDDAAPAAAPAKSPWRVLLPVLVGVGALLIGGVIGGVGGFRLAHVVGGGSVSMMDDRHGFGDDGFGDDGFGDDGFGRPGFGNGHPDMGRPGNGPFTDRRDGGRDDNRMPIGPPPGEQNDDAPAPDVTPAP